MSEVTRAEFDALKAELAGLKSEISRLAQALAQSKKEEEIPEEHLSVLAAAVAAYMGKRATIRYVRKAAGSHHESWRTQGRVTVAASHQLPRTKGW